MKTYSEILKDSRWTAKRNEIIKRDKACQWCGSSLKLEVHHKAYIKGRLPWEYDNRYLVTLCHECHEIETINYLRFKQLVEQKKVDGAKSSELIQMIGTFIDVDLEIERISDDEAYYDEIMKYIVWENLPKMSEILN